MMNIIKLEALQLFTKVIRVFEAITLEVGTVLNRSTKDTEHGSTNFCVSVIKVFEALTLTMIKVLNRSTKGGEHRDTKFSKLPVLVLWKIMDRLDYPDSLRIAYVCSEWRVASLSYTKDVKFRGESPPWIMVRSVQGSAENKFISISSGKTYIIFNEELCQAESKTLFSKQGWFLLHSKKDLGNVFLLNPFTIKKIELPRRSRFSGGRCGAFTIKDGKPDFVVVAAGILSHAYGCISLWTIRVGNQKKWKEHTYKYKPPDWIKATRAEIIGQHVYILSGTKRFLVFSLSSCEWIPVKQSWGDCKCAHLVKTDEGEIWKIHLPCPSFHRLIHMGWEEVKVKEDRHLCCFVKGGSIDYLVSRFVGGDVVDAFSDYMKESRFFKREIIEYENGANKVSRVVMYIMHEPGDVQWVDMP